MATKKKVVKSGQAPKAPRQSVTFDPTIYAELEKLAKEKKVSIAWLVRDATEKYIAEQYPLFSTAQ